MPRSRLTQVIKIFLPFSIIVELATKYPLSLCFRNTAVQKIYQARQTSYQVHSRFFADIMTYALRTTGVAHWLALSRALRSERTAAISDSMACLHFVRSVLLGQLPYSLGCRHRVAQSCSCVKRDLKWDFPLTGFLERECGVLGG
jgi:hypothetical protein